MSDDIVREYLTREAPRNRLMLLVNPFTRLSGSRALVVGLAIVLATVAVAILGNVRYDGIADLHTGQGAPLEPVLDWLTVALLFLVGGLIWAPKTQSHLDYFGMSAVGRLPFVLVGLIWMRPALGQLLDPLMHLNPASPPNLMALPGFPWIVAGGLVTMLLMAWGLFLNFFALREASGMKTDRAVLVYAGVVVLGEIISKVIVAVL